MQISGANRAGTGRLTMILASGLLIAVLAACAPGAAPTAAPPATPGPAITPGAGAIATPTGTSPEATPTPAGDVAAGRTVFQTNCESCHPGGRQGVGPALSGVVKRIGEDRVRSTVRNGRPGTAMPAFPETRINDKQLTDLIAYLRSL